MTLPSIAVTNATVFRLLLALVALAPLPLAAFRPWAWSLLGVAVGVLLAAWGLSVSVGAARAPVPVGRVAASMVLFATVVAWAALQTSSAAPQNHLHPHWAEAAAALGRPVASGISVDPGLTVTAMLRVVTYAGVFWLALQLGRERTRARAALVTVAVAAAAYSLYGLVVHYAGWERILWLEKWAYIGDLTSTFVNRNAFGAYAGLGVICCLGLFLHTLRPRRHHASRDAREFAENLLFRALPYLVAALTIGWALLLSHSRAAFLSTGAAMLVLLAGSIAGRVLPLRSGLILATAIVAIGFGATMIGGDATMERLATTGQVEDARTALYRLTVDAITDAPWIGHGFGAFEPAFRMYRDTSLDFPVAWELAHSVHLELAMDVGIPAAAAFYLSLALLIGHCLRGLMVRRRDQMFPAVAIAAAVLIGGHGLVDFSAQMPAVAVTLALLMGIGVAQSWSTHVPTR